MFSPRAPKVAGCLACRRLHPRCAAARGCMCSPQLGKPAVGLGPLQAAAPPNRAGSRHLLLAEPAQRILPENGAAAGSRGASQTPLGSTVSPGTGGATALDSRLRVVFFSSLPLCSLRAYSRSVRKSLREGSRCFMCESQRGLRSPPSSYRCQ